MRRVTIVLGALIVALTLAIAAVAGAQVPLKGADEGVWGEGTRECNGLFPVFVESSGVARHVGRYAYSSEECVNFATQTYAGEFEIEAANGDTIEGTYEGAFEVVGDTIEYEQQNTVDGGTGRFAHATGDFHVSGLASLVDCSAEGCLAQQELEGAISSVGSSTK